jgi:L-histidine Nalpha-methyltransferase / hercynylcysteine S-oxide synthase
MSPTIVDIRQNPSGTGADLRTEILNGLDAPGGSRTLPTLLLYDEQGLRLYDDITTKAHEYYLFRAEETILDHHADEIVSSIRQTGAPNHRGQEVVIELGAGYVPLVGLTHPHLR